jgi:hypothetical protein
MLDHAHDIGFRGGYQVATAQSLYISFDRRRAGRNMAQRSLLYDFLTPGEEKVLSFAAMPFSSMSLKRFPEPTTRKGLDRVIP